uniref:Uncharacterized protein n=1 Tax=Anguilla anguilla TaxID=7936 RepID=A0A0E9S126_ANGAN
MCHRLLARCIMGELWLQGHLCFVFQKLSLVVMIRISLSLGSIPK